MLQYQLKIEDAPVLRLLDSIITGGAGKKMPAISTWNPVNGFAVSISDRWCIAAGAKKHTG